MGVDGVDGVVLGSVEGEEDAGFGEPGLLGDGGADSRRAIRSSKVRMVFWIEARSRRIWTPVAI